MRPTDLHTAAACHFLGLSSTGYLVDVAHAALDRGIYAHGLGEIITSRNPIFAEMSLLFDSALKELGIGVSSQEEALERLAEGYMVALVEGPNAPREITREVYRDYSTLIRGKSWKGRWWEPFGALIPLLELLERYEHHEILLGESTDHMELDRECITLAQNWCREHWLPVLDPSWLTSTVEALARGIHDERAFDRLPILADALQDAGCNDADILDHCRGPGPHVRGCWVVDLVLSKS